MKSGILLDHFSPPKSFLAIKDATLPFRTTQYFSWHLENTSLLTMSGLKNSLPLRGRKCQPCPVFLSGKSQDRVESQATVHGRIQTQFTNLGITTTTVDISGCIIHLPFSLEHLNCFAHWLFLARAQHTPMGLLLRLPLPCGHLLPEISLVTLKPTLDHCALFFL